MGAVWAMYSWKRRVTYSWKCWVKYTCTVKMLSKIHLHWTQTIHNKSKSMQTHFFTHDLPGSQPASNVNLKTYLKSRLIWGVFPEKLLPWECYRTHWWCSQHWLRKCLGATMHQAITWINKDQDILVIIHRTWPATKYYQLTANILHNGDKYRADTWHNNNVIITSKRRCDAVLT